MQEYFILIGKCIIFYFVIIIALRVMGKREIGELSIFDIVIYLVMSELLAISISEVDESIWKSMVPIFTLSILQILLSIILLKSKKARDIVDGTGVIIIQNGQINQAAMKKERYSIDDMMVQLRDKDYSSPDEVAFAILESSGHLSIIPQNKCKVKYPFPLISDGIIDTKVLSALGFDEEWLNQALLKEGIEDYKDVFLCLYQKDGLFVIKRTLTSKDKLF
ncbi:MAG: DUF421 domain-containing protein [Erysipelotrichaceae bacterium]|nr:DUF421 domain-containing protein [Erysipelotrichaceae bacterium]